MMNTYDRFVGGWIGALVGNALGRFTEGKSPQQIEDSFPLGLRKFPEASTFDQGNAVRVLRDTSRAITSRSVFRRVYGAKSSPVDPVLRVLPTGLAAASAGLSAEETMTLAVEAMRQDDPPFEAAALMCAVWYALVLRGLVSSHGVAEVDSLLFDSVEYMKRPSPDLILTRDGETQVQVWGEAKLLLTEGVGAGINSLERFDFTSELSDPVQIAAGVIAWATTTDMACERALEYLVSRGGAAGDYGMIGGALIGGRVGFSQFPVSLLDGVIGLAAAVEEGAKLYRAAQEYKG